MEDFPNLEQKLNESLDYLKGQLREIRGGRAQAGIIENIIVDYYGVKQPLKALGSISTLDAKTLIIEPWDKNTLEPIANAITKSENGLQAVVEGERIRVPFPSLSEERRGEFIRLADKKTEETRIKLRRLRDEERKGLQQQERNKEISEDDLFRSKEKLEELFKEHFDKIEKLKEAKEKELSTV